VEKKGKQSEGGVNISLRGNIYFYGESNKYTRLQIKNIDPSGTKE
jgi:hypothetical protein